MFIFVLFCNLAENNLNNKTFADYHLLFCYNYGEMEITDFYDR